MDTGQALYEQIDKRINKLEEKVDPVIEFVNQQKLIFEQKKDKVLTIREFLNLTASGGIAAFISWWLTKGH